MIFLVYQLSEGHLFKHDESELEGFKMRSMDMPLEENGDAMDDNEETSGISGDEDFNGEVLVNPAVKRFNEHKKYPCSCPTSFKRMNFGELSYPRHHTSIVCNTAVPTMCNHGGTCREVMKTIWLLKHKTTGIPLNHNSRHGDLPDSLKESFYWDTEAISIDCRCTLDKK